MTIGIIGLSFLPSGDDWRDGRDRRDGRVGPLEQADFASSDGAADQAAQESAKERRSDFAPALRVEGVAVVAVRVMAAVVVVVVMPRLVVPLVVPRRRRLGVADDLMPRRVPRRSGADIHRRPGGRLCRLFGRGGRLCRARYFG